MGLARPGCSPDSAAMNLAALPDWVNWLAQDADGAWWGYEAEPNKQDHGWYENEVGRIVRLAQETPPADWETTLVKRIR